jgi:IMP dehydrogenase
VELKIPLISAAMDSITGKYMLVVMDKMGGLGILTRHINLENREELDTQMKEIKWAKDQGAKNVGCAVGLKGDVAYKIQMLVNVGCNIICIDVAHGDQFAEHGVDAIKVGIGPGAACTTRIITGFGYPQFSAIQEACEVIQRQYPKISVIADGGLRTSGDMVKSLWAGADACMIGYMLAGTQATPRIDDKRVYRGMSSRAASGRPDIAPEGIEMEMEDKGKTENVIEEYVKGIKSGLAMGGATNFQELRKNVGYVIVSPLSLEETLPRRS